MQRTAFVAQMHACVQCAQGRRVGVHAEAQLVDARFANLDLQRQAQAARRRRWLARGRRGRVAAQQGDAIGVQRGYGQVQPSPVVTARSFERLPARRVEAQHATRAGQRDVDALRREVAEQRAARGDHLHLRYERHQPGAAAGAVQGPESEGDQCTGHEHERSEARRQPSRETAPCGARRRRVARRSSGVAFFARRRVHQKVTPMLT